MVSTRILRLLFALVLGVAMTLGAAAEKIEPVLVKQTDASYPYELKRKGIEGTVTFEYVVGPTGNVESVRILEATHPRFGESVERAVMKWKFRPGVVDGIPVRVRARQSFSFQLNPEKKGKNDGKGEPGATDNPDGAQR